MAASAVTAKHLSFIGSSNVHYDKRRSCLRKVARGLMLAPIAAPVSEILLSALIACAYQASVQKLARYAFVMDSSTTANGTRN